MNRFLKLLLNVSVVLMLFIGAASGENHALLVGIDNYAPGYAPSLPSCVNDANGIRETVLLSDPGGRWDESNIAVLTDSMATKAAIRGHLQTLAQAAAPGDIVLYFHSSHGGQTAGTSTYLCSYNLNYTDTELGIDLALFNTDATVIVCVDACHSGGLFKGEEPAGEWKFIEGVIESYTLEIEKKAKEKGDISTKDFGSNIAFMVACDYDESCWAGSPFSLYAGHIIMGSSMPTVDADSSGTYSFWELHSHAAAQASAENPEQTAQHYNQALLESTIVKDAPAVTTLAEALDNDSLAWQTFGDAEWFGQAETTHDGVDAAQSACRQPSPDPAPSRSGGRSHRNPPMTASNS